MTPDQALEEGAAGSNGSGGPDGSANPTARDVARELAEASPDTSRSVTLSWQDPMATAARGLEMTGLQYMRALRDKEVPPPPIAVLMNLIPVEINEGQVTFSALPGEEHYNPIGIVHGGFTATLLDSVLGCAVHTTLDAGVAYASLGLEVKYLRAVTRETGAVRAEAEVTYRGGRQATAEARMLAEQSGKLLATGTSTCLILG